MQERLMGGVLRATAAMVNMLARVVAPRLRLDVFPHRLYAMGRTWRHLDAYRDGPSSIAIELGGWTIDASWRARKAAAKA